MNREELQVDDARTTLSFWPSQDHPKLELSSPGFIIITQPRGTLALVNQLVLDIENDGPVFQNAANNIVSGLGGVVVTDELRTLVEDRLEKFLNEFPFAGHPNV